MSLLNSNDRLLREARNDIVHRKALLRIYDPQTETDKAINELKKQQQTISSQQKNINATIIAIVSVVAIGFISIVICAVGIFIDNQRNLEQRYNEYVSKIEKTENRHCEIEQNKIINQSIPENKKQEDINNKPGDNTLVK